MMDTESKRETGEEEGREGVMGRYEGHDDPSPQKKEPA